MKKKDKENKELAEVVEETAVAIVSSVTESEETAGSGETLEVVEKKQSKQSPIKMIDGWVNTAKNISGQVSEIYNDWVKPIRDNWTQIKRRLSLVTTIISIIFFILYVPFLLFSKISKDLSLGWDVALYVCIGVYIATVLSLLIVTLASGNSTSTAMEKRRKQVSKIILLVLRLASLAMGITALIISAMEGSADHQTAVVDTIAIIFAVMSIIFTSFPLVFGGIGGFVKWLISPARMKFTFSFVLLEWYHSFTSEQMLDKNMRKLAKRYGTRVGGCIDKYFLPTIGNKYIKSVDEHVIQKMFESVADEDVNMCEWITKRVFDYAEDCGYIENNPCDRLELYGDIAREGKIKKQSSSDKKTNVFNRALNKVTSLFKRKKDKTEEKENSENAEDTEDIQSNQQ